VEALIINDKPSSYEVHALEVEWKPPPSLRHEFLAPNSIYFVIVNASLSASQIDSLLRVLRMYHKTVWYYLDILKGNFVCVHCVLIEVDHKLSIEHQKRLNPNMQEVLRKKFKVAQDRHRLLYL